MAHGGTHIAAAAAMGAEGGIVQKTGFEILSQKRIPLCLQSLILVLCLLHGILRAIRECGHGSLQHIALHLLVDGLNAGLFPIDLRSAGIGTGFVLFPGAGKPGIGPG